MWSRVFRFFKGKCLRKKDLEVWKGEIQEDLDGIRKILRRQGLFSEEFKREALALLEERGLKDAEPLLQLADSFFYFESSLLEEPGLTEGQDEAAEMVWRKIELLLSGFGLELIRRTGEPFDPRFHQAVEKAEGENGNMVVTKIIQPGYLRHGQVIRPARVILGDLPGKEEQEL